MSLCNVHDILYLIIQLSCVVINLRGLRYYTPEIWQKGLLQSKDLLVNRLQKFYLKDILKLLVVIRAYSMIGANSHKSDGYFRIFVSPKFSLRH